MHSVLNSRDCDCRSVVFSDFFFFYSVHSVLYAVDHEVVFVIHLLRKGTRTTTKAMCLHTTRWATSGLFGSDTMSHVPRQLRKTLMTFHSTPLVFTETGLNMGQWLLTHDPRGSHGDVRQGSVHIRVSVDTKRTAGDTTVTDPHIIITPYVVLLSRGNYWPNHHTSSREVYFEEISEDRGIHFQTLLSCLIPKPNQSDQKS